MIFQSIAPPPYPMLPPDADRTAFDDDILGWYPNHPHTRRRVFRIPLDLPDRIFILYRLELPRPARHPAQPPSMSTSDDLLAPTLSHSMPASSGYPQRERRCPPRKSSPPKKRNYILLNPFSERGHDTEVLFRFPNDAQRSASDQALRFCRPTSAPTSAADDDSGDEPLASQTLRPAI